MGASLRLRVHSSAGSELRRTHQRGSLCLHHRWCWAHGCPVHAHRANVPGLNRRLDSGFATVRSCGIAQRTHLESHVRSCFGGTMSANVAFGHRRYAHHLNGLGEVLPRSRADPRIQARAGVR